MNEITKVETKAPITDKTSSKTQRYTTLHSLFSEVVYYYNSILDKGALDIS